MPEGRFATGVPRVFEPKTVVEQLGTGDVLRQVPREGDGNC
jgi:hypothetical protein